MKDIIKEEFKKHGVTDSDLVKDFGMKQPNANAIINGSRKVGSKRAKEFHEKYGVDYNILLFNENSLNTNTDPLNDDKSSIPMYNFPASAGGVEMYNDPSDVKIVGYLSIPGTQKGSFALLVHGHSMYPTLENGSWCVVRPIIDVTEIMWGEIYYIEWSDYRVFKRLLEGDADDEVILWSDNQLDKIGDRAKYSRIVIKKQKIRKLCLLTEILKKPNY